MPSIYDLKPAFGRLLSPLVDALARLGVTPNTVTIAAIVLSAAGGVLVAKAPDWRPALLLVPVLLFVRMALNAIDGLLARRYDKSTRLGEVLNELGDVVSDTLLYTPLLLLVEHTFWAFSAVLGFVIVGILTEFSGILVKSMTGERRYDGPMGKSDRAFLVGAYCLVLYFAPGFAHYGVCVFSVAVLLLIWSCINRLRPALSTNVRQGGSL